MKRMKRMNEVKEMLFLNQKFNILKLKTDPNSLKNVTDSYAYAWYNGVYPFFEDSAEWHKPYAEFFNVTEEMMDDLSKHFDDAWTAGNKFSFYDLESHYGISGTSHPGVVWDRMQLVFACRYMYLNDAFDDSMWDALCENMKCPSEAHSIRREFKIDDLYFL
jgi:hypothetical protein